MNASILEVKRAALAALEVKIAALYREANAAIDCCLDCDGAMYEISPLEWDRDLLEEEIEELEAAQAA